MIEKQKSLDLDEIVSIEDMGVLDTYDFTIPETHCFFANDILVHNSLEEDADIVLLGNRPFLYTRDVKDEGKATWEIAKHRDGATRTIDMMFDDKTTTFFEITKAYEG